MIHTSSSRIVRLRSQCLGEAAASTISAGDTAWVLTSTALVLLMNIPGLSLFYGGLTRQKNVLSMLAQCFACTAVVTVLWTAVGYSMAFSTVGMEAGVVNPSSFVGGLDKCFLAGVSASSVWGTIPEILFFAFQCTFAIITPALMVGAFAERMKFSAVMLFVALWSLAVYSPVAHAVWGGAGSFFGDMGVLDFAGGIVVHVTAGIGALLACIMVGPRKDAITRPHSLVLTMIGAGMLWVGWFGFNGGSALSASGAAAMALVATQISAATAALVWMALDLMDPAVAKPSALGIATGSIAGLAAITPAAGFVGPLGACVIGAVSAVLCRIFTMELKFKWNYDDALDVFNVHGVGGIVGTLLVSVFAHPMFGGNQVGIDIWAQLLVQSGATVGVGLYTLVVSWVLLKAVSAMTGGLRDDAVEALGMDSEHGEEGYHLVPQEPAPRSLTTLPVPQLLVPAPQVVHHTPHALTPSPA
ncbi:MAG: hypothetical protein WDW36_003961 [Sanguina aurantia]